MRLHYNQLVKRQRTSWAASPLIQLILWLVLGGILLYLALRNVEIRKVWSTLTQANGWYISLALLSVAINTWGKAVRWQVLLSPSNKPVSLRSLLATILIGQTINWYLPGRVGDLTRIYLVGKNGQSRTFTLGTIGLEKIIDWVSYLLIFLWTLILLPLPAIVSDSVYTLAIATLVMVAIVFLLARYPIIFAALLRRVLSVFPDRIHRFITPRIDAGLESLKVFRSRTEIVKLVMWSALIWGTSIWTNHLVGQALGMQLPVLASMIVLVVLLAGVVVPSIPGRIGIFQYLCILALSPFSIDQAMSVSYGILLQGIIMLPTTLVSLALMSILGLRPNPEGLSEATDLE